MTTPQHPAASTNEDDCIKLLPSISTFLHRDSSSEQSQKDMNRTKSKTEDRKRKTGIAAMNPDDSIDDEVALHHSDKKVQSPKRRTMKNRDGVVKRSTPTKRRTNTVLKPPPPLPRTKPENSSVTRVRGFDATSLAWLQRIEEVATIWLNMLVQQQHLYRQYQDSLSLEKQRIVDFCTRSLQQILSEGGFRSYTTPSYPPALYSQTLPPLQDFPIMVVTLKHWYSTLLSRCQHHTAVAMLPHRVLAPQQLSQISVEEYIHACENEVKRWLRSFTEAETKSKNSFSSRGITTNQNPTNVAVWMQQLQKKSVPTYSPVKPRSKVSVTTQATSSPHQTKVGGRIPSPTDVMMFDSVAAVPISTQEKCDEEDGYEDAKPAAKYLSNSSTIKSGCASSTNTNISLEKANDMRGLILSLYHADKCPFPSDRDDGRGCPVSKGCRAVKDLWHHITSSSNRRCCIQNMCSFSRLALLAEVALAHFGHCKKVTCFICGPVLAQMPKVKRDIATAVKASHRQTAAVEEAILQVVNDITYVVDDPCSVMEANDTTCSKDNSEGIDKTEYTKPIIATSSSDVLTISNQTLMTEMKIDAVNNIVNDVVAHPFL